MNLQTPNRSSKPMKFLYSYGGRIIPRPTDGKLRYAGGFTRILAVDRSITFSELMDKFAESCGSSMKLTCKLPSEDLDLLVTVKSDEELKSVIEEYERVDPKAQIRAIMFPIKPAAPAVKKATPPMSPVSCFDFPSKPPLPPRCAANAQVKNRHPYAVGRKYGGGDCYGLPQRIPDSMKQCCNHYGFRYGVPVRIPNMRH